MTILAVIKDVCATVGVVTPTSVFNNINANRTMQEMLSLANEMAQRIAYDEREWSRLKTTVTYTGNAVWMGVPASSLPDDQVWSSGTSAFDLPADYKRMLLTSNVWRSTSNLSPMLFFPDTDEWLNRRARDWSDGCGEWTMLGGKIHIWPVMHGVKPAVPRPPEPDIPAIPAETIYFTYLQKNCVALASGGFGDRFIADGDSYLLDERLLKLGMIWQWKAQKGTAYNEDLGNYSTALAIAEGTDSPSPIIIGRKSSSFAAKIAYPFTPVPTP